MGIQFNTSSKCRLASALGIVMSCALPVAAAPASDLADLFVRACVTPAPASPFTAAQKAAAANKWKPTPFEIDQRQDFHGAPYERETWIAGAIGKNKIRLQAVKVDAQKAVLHEPACPPVEYCSVNLAKRGGGIASIEAALKAKLKLGAPTAQDKHDSRAADETQPNYVTTSTWKDGAAPGVQIIVETGTRGVTLASVFDCYSN
jgi:hypothetical protein